MRGIRLSLVTITSFLLLAVSAGAQTKISGTATCGKPDVEQKVDVGDRVGHSFIVSQGKCTWTKPLEIAGSQDKEGLNTGFDEISGSKSRSHGYYVDTMATGDKAHVSYHGAGTLKDGQLQSVQGEWTYTGGTGKLKGLTGKGTYKGTAAADGTVTYEVEGEYELPKK